MKKSFEGLSAIIASLEGMQEEQDRIIKRMAQRLAQIFLREVTRRTPVGIGSFEPQEKGRGTYYKFEKRKDNATGKSRWEPIRSTKKAGGKKLQRIAQGGTLRRAWVIRGIRKTDGVWTATIFNPMEYASYVENGHRQQPGRFVPALGKTLKAGWVEGRFMMKLSAEFVEKEGAAYVQQEFEKYLRGHWHG